MHSKSFVWLFAFVAILFTMGFAPYLTQNAFADVATINGFTVDDPDDGDTVYSIGDTITITFDVATNQTGVVTDANIAGNFTFTNQNINDNTFSGTWTTNQILTLTVNAITTSPIIGTTGITALAGNNIGVLGENNEDNTHNAEGTDIKLTGDFGLVIAVTANNGGGSGCNGDCEEPTLGVDSTGKRFVGNGFTYNGKSVDVERFFTPYPLITADVGKLNKAEFKIYENQGPEHIKHFSFAFGLRDGQIISESKAMIELDIDHEGTETVTVTDPENALSNVRVETSQVACNGDDRVTCLGVTIFHTFRAPLDFNIVATDVWDRKRSSWQNYYNHGIEVVGESLNPPKEYDGIDKRQVYHLTETGKTSALDEFGNSWTLKYGLWDMDYIPTKKIIDGVEQNGIDRNNAWFNIYKQGQELIAIEVLEKLCPFCSDREFAEINDIFTYEFPTQIEKSSDSEIQDVMLQESMIAENTLLQIFESLYKNYHY